jgi:pilus assembly protein CpaB
MATGRRRGRAIILIAFILILLIVLFLVFSQFNPFAQRGPQAETNVVSVPTATVSPVEKVVVVAQKISQGQEVRAEYLATGEVSRESFNSGLYFKDLSEVIGTRSKFDLEAGTLLTKTMVVRPGDPGVPPSFEIPQGKVAISVPVSKLSSLAYGLQKGDHVNVIVSLLINDLDASFQTKLPNRTGIVIAPGPISENQTYVTALLNGPPEYTVAAPSAASYLGRIEIDPTLNNPVFVLPAEPQRPRLVSQTLIQDVVVLQLGSFNQAIAQIDEASVVSVPESPDAQAATPTRTPRTQQQETAVPEAVKPPDVITLIVSPQDAVTLNYLMLAGANLNMVLRSAGDTQAGETEAVTLQFVLDQYRIPNPAKLPYGLEPRMDTFPTIINPFAEPGVLITPEPQQ